MSFEPCNRLPERVADVVRLDPWRSRSAWECTARHLNAEGMAAAVPAELVRYLERRGLLVWAADRGAA
jgi:hypothetical protein